MQKILSYIHLVVIYGLLAFVLIKSNFVQVVTQRLFNNPLPEMSAYQSTLFGNHRRIDRNVLNGAILLFGDSHIQGLNVNNIGQNIINFGIGSSTSKNLLERYDSYSSLKNSKAVYIAIGFNDLKYRSNEALITNLQTIISNTPKQNKIIISTIMLTGENYLKNTETNLRILEINRQIKLIVNKNNHLYLFDPNTFLTKLDNLRIELSEPDGVHLNANGYEIYMRELKNQFSTLNLLSS